MISFWDVIGRSESGTLVKEEEFDWKVAQTSSEIVERYDIRYDPEQVVPSDEDLVDRVYQAGLDLFLELGMFCRDTGRVLKFTRKEVEMALKHAPTTVTYGQGKDLAVMACRSIEDTRPPFCLCTPVGAPVAEERFVPMVQSFAQEPLADTFSSAFSQTVHGRPIKSGTPQEVEAAIWNVIKLREAAQAAGRPGMGIHNLVSNAEQTDAILAAVQADFGVLPNDGLAIAAISELKMDYERVKKVAFLRHSGHNKYGLYGPLMGGYAGGPESTAVVLVAHHFLGLLAFEAQWHCCFPLHIHHFCNTSRELLWLISIATQALSRNTHLLVTISPFAAAGPCTEMVVYEIVANVLASTVSGGDLNLVAVASNRYPERATGMEARMGAEAGHLAARQGVTRTQANDIVKQLLNLYESRISDAPLGKRFDECYDMETVQPTQKYLDLYEGCKKKLSGFGLDYS
ncbi:MAG: monomethylamine:corrinoid methyltransferase [Candidatus Marinimicrobia bacterium]|jgi:methylamine--corrinoid protein Co-methyltransferase|nr:monomethylamine:corrinoid methyltransferase [Candidatus Neomarinimicrobiota bacterium]